MAWFQATRASFSVSRSIVSNETCGKMEGGITGLPYFRHPRSVPERVRSIRTGKFGLRRPRDAIEVTGIDAHRLPVDSHRRFALTPAALGALARVQRQFMQQGCERLPRFRWQGSDPLGGGE